MADNLALIKPQAGCRVRVVHALFKERWKVVDHLRRLRHAGCGVKVIVNEISQAMFDRLRRSDPGLGAVTDIRVMPPTDKSLHNKYILFYDGGSIYRVITGSPNLTDEGNTWNDEVFFRTAISRAVHDQYYYDFLAVQPPRRPVLRVDVRLAQRRVARAAAPPAQLIRPTAHAR